MPTRASRRNGGAGARSAQSRAGATGTGSASSAGRAEIEAARKAAKEADVDVRRCQDAIAGIHDKGAQVLSALEAQVASASKMADEYLESGLLGQHTDAVKMRDQAQKMLNDARSKLGIASAGRSEVELTVRKKAAPSSNKSVATSVAKATPLPAPRTCVDSGVASALHSSVNASRSNLESNTTTQDPPIDADRVWTTSSAAAADLSSASGCPRYRWCKGEDGDRGALLELELGTGVEMPEVDISETNVRFIWSSDQRELALPFGFCADVTACRIKRRKKKPLGSAGPNAIVLELVVAFAAMSVPPAARLSVGLAASEAFGVFDGFVAGAEADAIRLHILSLWKSGQLEEGEVEGGYLRDKRSDKYLFLTDLDASVLAFTRRMDKLVLELSGRVGVLGQQPLVRGNPMATVYSGEGARYVPHFDCSGGDNGRVVTCILYLNPFWRKEDGAELLLWPEATSLTPTGACHTISPLHGRLVTFVCDSRNLHAVSPVAGCLEALPEPRLALSVWYYDSERIGEIAATERLPKDAPAVSQSLADSMD